MQRIAIIDIGSNSARLVISHLYKNGAFNMVYNQKETLRLAQKVDSDNMLTEEAFASTIETMRTFAYMCKIYEADKTIAVATAAIRNASNGGELIRQVAEKTGIHLHIISGETEAYFSYLGVINTINVKDGIVFDLGGGSIEIILFKDRKLVESISLPMGAVNTTEMFNTRNELPANVLSDMSFFIHSRLARLAWVKQPDLPLIGVGGTARTVAKIIQRSKKYPTTKIHNYSFSAQTYRNYFTSLVATDFEQRKRISGLGAERNDIILAGSTIINCLIEEMGTKTMIVSGCGLRDGLFYDYYAKSFGLPVIADDILALSRENMLKLYERDAVHARHVTTLALAMFDGWKDLHKLRKGFRPLLETAALLHDIGISINFYSHARHSAYMIQNAKLFGLTHKEQLITSAVAGWHNGVSKNYFRDNLYQEMLTESNWRQINKLALLLALAESMDYSETRQIRAIETCLKKRTAVLRLYSRVTPSIELHQIESQIPWFQKAFGVDLRVELIKLNAEDKPADA